MEPPLYIRSYWLQRSCDIASENHTFKSHRKHGLTPWSRILYEKLTVAQLVKKFPAFYGSRRFITMFKRASHWTLFWARWTQSTNSRFIPL